jgi:uncharacterized membrane protein
LALVEDLVEVPRRHFKAFITMLVSSLASLTSSLVLSTDAIALAKNANAALSCNVNAVVSCGKVALSWQSNLLGFPNAFIGLICEPVVITVAVAGLSRTRFPDWFMKTALTVYGAALIFAFWLFGESYFVIKAFCPWCLLVTVSTVTVFASMLRINLLDNTFHFSSERHEKISNFLERGRDAVVVTAIYTLMATIVILKYGKYFLPGS